MTSEIHKARSLRKDQTDTERLLWSRLRNRQVFGAKFRRQHPVGGFFADFCCPETGLVVEVDGGQHVESVEADRERTEVLVSLGYRVLRFWNHEVLEEIDAVLLRIAEALERPPLVMGAEPRGPKR